MWNWKWDKKLYPGLDKKIREWKEEGIHFLGYINPFIALEGEIFQEAKANNYLVKDKECAPYLVKITTFPAAMVDFTNPYAYEWYKDIIKENMIDFGLSGWMADFGEYLPTDCVLYSGDNPEDIHNMWPAIWAGLNLEAIWESGVEDEVFFFTRAGSTGTIAKSMMMWTGDQHVDWSMDDGIPAVIPATFSLAASGYPVAHSDAGDIRRLWR
jgi:alpha-glucosidase